MFWMRVEMISFVEKKKEIISIHHQLFLSSFSSQCFPLFFTFLLFFSLFCSFSHFFPRFQFFLTNYLACKKKPGLSYICTCIQCKLCLLVLCIQITDKYVVQLTSFNRLDVAESFENNLVIWKFQLVT